MALFSISNIKLTGIAACVPKNSESNLNYDWITEQERALLIKTTGIENRRVASNGETTSDLCFEASQKLLSELKWDKNEIEIIVFVSQSRDYFLPATAIILQERLGLPLFSAMFGCDDFCFQKDPQGFRAPATMVAHLGLRLSGVAAGESRPPGPGSAAVPGKGHQHGSEVRLPTRC